MPKIIKCLFYILFLATFIVSCSSQKKDEDKSKASTNNNSQEKKKENTVYLNAFKLRLSYGKSSKIISSAQIQEKEVHFVLPNYDDNKFEYAYIESVEIGNTFKNFYPAKGQKIYFQNNKGLLILADYYGLNTNINVFLDYKYVNSSQKENVGIEKLELKFDIQSESIDVLVSEHATYLAVNLPYVFKEKVDINSLSKAVIKNIQGKTNTKMDYQIGDVIKFFEGKAYFHFDNLKQNYIAKKPAILDFSKKSEQREIKQLSISFFKSLEYSIQGQITQDKIFFTLSKNLFENTDIQEAYISNLVISDYATVLSSKITTEYDAQLKKYKGVIEVQAEDGSSHSYNIIISKILSAQNDLKSLAMLIPINGGGFDIYPGYLTNTNVIQINIPKAKQNSDFSKVYFSNYDMSANAVAEYSANKILDLSNEKLTFNIYAENGIAKNYIASLNFYDESNEKKINLIALSFEFEDKVQVLTGKITNQKIEFIFDSDQIDFSKLKGVYLDKIDLIGKSINYQLGEKIPFTNLQAMLEITANDGSKNAYNLSIKNIKRTAIVPSEIIEKVVINYQFEGKNYELTGHIDGHTIYFVLPFYTDNLSFQTTISTLVINNSYTSNLASNSTLDFVDAQANQKINLTDINYNQAQVDFKIENLISYKNEIKKSTLFDIDFVDEINSYAFGNKKYFFVYSRKNASINVFNISEDGKIVNTGNYFSNNSYDLKNVLDYHIFEHKGKQYVAMLNSKNYKMATDQKKYSDTNTISQIIIFEINEGLFNYTLNFTNHQINLMNRIKYYQSGTDAYLALTSLANIDNADNIMLIPLDQALITQAINPTKVVLHSTLNFKSTLGCTDLTLKSDYFYEKNNLVTYDNNLYFIFNCTLHNSSGSNTNNSIVTAKVEVSNTNINLTNHHISSIKEKFSSFRSVEFFKSKDEAGNQYLSFVKKGLNSENYFGLVNYIINPNTGRIQLFNDIQLIDTGNSTQDLHLPYSSLNHLYTTYSQHNYVSLIGKKSIEILKIDFDPLSQFYKYTPYYQYELEGTASTFINQYQYKINTTNVDLAAKKVNPYIINVGKNNYLISPNLTRDKLILYQFSNYIIDYQSK